MQRNEDTSSKKNLRKRKLNQQQVLPAETIDIPEEKVEEKVNKKEPVRKRRKKNDDKDVAQTAEETAAAEKTMLEALQPTKKIVAREFSSRDVDFLSINEKARYLNPSKKVGHAVIVKDAEGNDVALQYHIPKGEEDVTPEFRPLNNIEEIHPYGMTRYRANTPNGTQMFATRFEDGEFDGEKLRIWNFSPSLKKNAEPFWGSDKELPIFNANALEDDELKAELAEIYKKGQQTKGGRVLPVDPASVVARDVNPKRNPDQNTVMGESAKDAFEAFLENWEDELTDEMKTLFKRSVEAPLKDMFKGQHRPEWLHAEGHSLTPMSIDPQRKDNLGAAPKWANTEMMILERIVKWFALNRPEAKEAIRPHFEMLFDSDLIKKIYFNVSIEEQGHIFNLSQEINPLKMWPLFRKPTDLTQATAVTYSMLHGIDPVKKDNVKKTGEKLRAHQPASAAAAAEKPTAGKLAQAHVAEKPAAPQIVAPVPVRAQAPVAVHQAAAQPAAQHPLHHTEAVPASFPTQMVYQNSVLQITSTFQEPDYDEPWHGARTHGCHGSGLVVENLGKKYILTNAHVVENTVDLDVRFANDHNAIFPAKVKCVSYQCDLALLEIDDAAFQQRAVPVSLGEMVSLSQPVETVGFPMGGNEVNISKGIVSRIEVGDYSMSGLDMLQVGIDAAINPGNSGGPVFSHGIAVGVAFQGYVHQQGLGFMIPMPIVKHFLTEALSDKPYRGFPILPVEMQTLENAALRMSYGMKPNQTGVRVKKIDTLSDAFSKLKTDDILLEIDGLPISNVGTVDIPGIGNVIDLVHVTHSKFIGETVNLKVLRVHPGKSEPEILDIDVVMDNVPFDSTKVPVTEHDKMPTYFVCSGISFMPVTRNYLEDRGAELEEMINEETGDRITDVAKKSPDEQYVVINTILKCKETYGYDQYTNLLVKEVNGKEVKNIKEVVEAMESNKGPYHIIGSKGKSKIVVKNMTADENAKLLKKYHIPFDRSEDLKPVDAMDIDAPVAPKAPVSAPVSISAAKPSASKSHSFFAAKPVAKKAESAEDDESELLKLDDNLEPISDEGSLSSSDVMKTLTADMLPGLKRYRAAIENIEYKARNGGYDDLEDEEDDMDFEDVGSNDSSLSEDESEDSSDEKGVNRKPTKKPANSSAFFGKGTKRKRDEDDEEESRHSKRFKSNRK